MKKIFIFLSMIIMALGCFSGRAMEVKLRTNLKEATSLTVMDASGMRHISYGWDVNNESTVDLPDDATLRIQLISGYSVESITVDDIPFSDLGDDASFSGGAYWMKASAIKAVSKNETPLIVVTAKENEKTYLTIKGDPTMIDVRYLFQTFDSSSWKDGELNFTVTDLTLPIDIVAKTDYALKAVICNGNNELGEPGATSYSINPRVLHPGSNVYEVEAYTLEDARTESFTLKVTGRIFDVSVRRRGAQAPLPASALLKPITFNPATELPITISHSTYGKSIYSVSIDGVAVPRNSEGNFSLDEIPNGAVVSVIVDYPDVMVPVKFNFLNPDTEGSIKEVTDNLHQIVLPSVYLAEDFAVQLGESLHVTFNTSNYVVSATLNGEGNYDGGLSFTVTEETPYVIEVMAEPKAPYKITLYHYEPAHFGVRIGNTDVITPMSDSDMTEIDVPRNQNRLHFVADEGWAITEIYMDGIECGLDPTVEGDVTFDVYSEEYARDLEAVFYFDPAAEWLNRSVTLSLQKPGLEKIVKMDDGYSILHYNEADRPFAIEADLVGGGEVYAYLNGERVSFFDMSDPTYINWSVMPENSVIKFFPSEPAVYGLTFEIAEGVEAEILKDIITPVEPVGTVDMLEGTLVAINSATEDAIKVSLDGTELTPSEAGEFSFNVNASHAVSIRRASNVGVGEIGQDDVVTVYSLQGIKIIDNGKEETLFNLPAGIYIVNGEKRSLLR